MHKQPSNDAGAPELDIDLFSDENLANSAPAFKKLRDAGPAVWVPAINMYVISRYADVYKALRAADTLICGEGVSVNPMLNGADAVVATSTLTTDGMEHHKFKKLVRKPLAPKSVMEVRGTLEEEAKKIVNRFATGDEFDAVSTVASHLPLTVVSQLVGLEGVDGLQMLEWSKGIFDAFGPMESPRTQSSFAKVKTFIDYVAQFDRKSVTDGGWADHMISAGERGDIAIEEAHSLVFDFVVPSLDTTIYSTVQMLHGLATTPSAYEAVRDDPSLVPGIVNEAVRMATVIRGFTRLVKEDYNVSEDITLPAGSRAFILYAAANLDERHYENPDKFDIHRNPLDQLAWGHGTHICAGMHLARAEMESVLRAIIAKVDSIELVGTPTRLMLNSVQGYATLPMKFHPKD